MGFFDRIFKKNKKEEKIEKNIEETQDNILKETKEEDNQIKSGENIIEKELVIENIEENTQIYNELETSKIESEEEKEPETKFEEREELEKDEFIEDLEAVVQEKKEPEEEKPEEAKYDLKEKTNEEKGFFASLRDKLFRTREGFFGKIKNVFLGKKIIDGELYEELEDILIQSDIGMDMTVKIVNELETEVKKRKIKNPEEIYPVLKEVMASFLISENNELDIRDGELNVILVVGVNGVGKTTTIGKIAKKLKKSGKSVIIGAADTFRAAAVEQLEEWGKRAEVKVIKKEEGADPGAVVYDTIQYGLDKKVDVAIIDTAGRLHNKNNLMKELEKINNVIIKKLGHTRYETILVIDGTTGQNGLIQASTFNKATKLTGFIVTKLDGTAKGGVVFSISEEIKKPIKYIGVGEQIDDLRPFNTKDYIDAIFD